MRAIAPALRAVMAGRNWRALTKLWIEDPDGVMRDVTAFHGVNWLDRVEWNDNADQPTASGTITLLREDLDAGVSLAPAIGASPANRNALDEYAPFLKEGRDFQITHAVAAAGVPILAGDYFEVMRGRIDTIGQSHDRNEIRLDFRDPGAVLLDHELIESRVYADNEAGLPLEDVIQASLDDEHGAGAFVLYVPVPTDTIVRNITIGDGKHLERLRDVVLASAGWDLRYRYDSAGVLRLTLSEPRRAFDPDVDTPDTLFAANEYTAIPRLDIGIADVRNFIRVGYRDVATGQREHVDARDMVSDDEYDTRFMELNFADDGNINTADEADALAAAALHDLATPYSDHDVATIPFAWFAQIGDVYEFEANDTVYDSNQIFGVLGVTHVLTADGGESVFVTKGKVIGAVKEWKRRARVVLGPSDDEAFDETPRLRNFREIRRDPAQVTYGWEPDVRAIEQWLYLYTYDQPVLSDPWPTMESLNPIRLTAGTTEYTIPIPATGKITYGLLVPMDADYHPGDGQRITVHPLDALPIFDNFEHAPGADGNYRDASFTVRDPGGFGGSLRVWVAKTSPLDASAIGIPDGTYAIPATPAAVGPTTPFVLAGGGSGNLLDEIRVHPGRGKRISVEFVNTLGISSGIASFVLLSSGGPVDSDGNLLAGIINTATQFAATIKPVSVYNGLPATGYVGEVALNTGETPPKLYRWNQSGGVWSAATPTSDLSGTITTVQIAVGAVTAAIIAAGAVTTTKIEDGAISTPKLVAGAVTTTKLAAGAVTANEIAALTILAGNIAAGAITTGKISANAITANELATDSVIAGKVAAGAINTAALQAGAVTAAKISVTTLASMTSDAGIIVAGKLQNAAGTQYLDLNASGSNGFLVHPRLTLRANGNAEFTGDVTIIDTSSVLQFKKSSGELTAQIVPYFLGSPINQHGLKIKAYDIGGTQTTEYTLFFGQLLVDDLGGGHGALIQADTLNLWSAAASAYRSIQVDAADTAGVGFRRLRVAN